jgi:hypothetical protein
MSLALLSLTACEPAKALPADPAPPVSSADETLEHNARETIIAKVNAAITDRDFATLDAMGQDFRTSRERTPGGAWKLWVYHAQLQYNLGGAIGEGRCDSPMAPFVAQWRAASPLSPAAAITDAALLLQQAWCYRGGGYAGEVPEQAWPRFAGKVEAAAAILERSQRQASLDPEFYAIKLEAMRMQGADRGSFDRVLAEAGAREPAYQHIYSNAAVKLLPQWGGSYPQVEALARSAAEASRSSYGMGLYAQIFRSLEECGCDIYAEAADWTTMKVAMRDLYTRYPVRNNAEYFADLSCRMGDGAEGRRYIRALHPEATGEGDFAALFASCDNQASLAG